MVPESLGICARKRRSIYHAPTLHDTKYLTYVSKRGLNINQNDRLHRRHTRLRR